MSTLASASQAVLDATYNAYDPKDPIALRRCAAAALRAAAEHCVPDDSEGHWIYTPNVLAIANELEAQ